MDPQMHDNEVKPLADVLRCYHAILRDPGDATVKDQFLTALLVWRDAVSEQRP